MANQSRFWPRLFAGIGSIAALPAMSILWALGFRRLDSWRRTLGLGLRSEGSKFALSSFGLDAFGEADLADGPHERTFAARLREYLQREVAVGFSLRHGRFCVERIEMPERDLVLGEFQEDGALAAITILLDPRFPPSFPEPELALLSNAIIAAYNETRELPEPVRPQRLRQAVISAGIPSRDLIDRLLSAAFLSFESAAVTPSRRIVPPSFHARRNLGHGMLNIVARWLPDHRSIDVWFHVHHVAADGAPIQEVLTRLERAWGVRSPLTIASADTAEDHIELVSCTGERTIHCLTMLADFAPLLALRRTWKEQLGTDIPLAPLLIWLLAREPVFFGKRFGLAIEMPEAADYGRSVSILGLSPDLVVDFPAFVQQFGSDLQEIRERRGPSHRAMLSAALLPAALGSATMRLNPSIAGKTFGTIGLSILREAKVFVAPMSDYAFDDGFIAIGSLSLPGDDGIPRATITIKGDAARIMAYPAAIRKALSGATL